MSIVSCRTVYTKQNHPCGKCLKTIPAGEKVIEVTVRAFRVGKWGNEIPCQIPVRYHPKHAPQGLGSNS